MGNGVTNDTAAIQAAINAAYAAGGGTVYLKAGTYIVSGTADKSDGAIRLLDYVTLQGAGMGQTILKVMDNNAAAITGVVRTPYNQVTHDVAMYDLTIDGNRANNLNKIDGFYTGVAPGDTRQDYNITVQRVEVMNCTGYGFDPHEQTRNLRISDSVAHHNVLDGFVADFLVGSVFENNLAYANDRHGFNITTSTTGLQLNNNVAHDNGSAGLVIQRGSENITAPHGITVQGGAYYNNAREGIYVKIADHVTITGVDIYGNNRQGIRVDGGTEVLINGATVHNNSQEAAGIYDEIRIGRFNDTAGSSGLIFDSTGVQVQNSTIYSNAAILSRYAIYEAPDVTGVNGETANTIGPVGTGTTYFAPQLVTPATDQSGSAGTAFAYQVPPSSFVDGDDGTFTLSATLASGAALPSWLVFNPATGQFTGTPPAAGIYQIVVQARDAQGLKDTTTFEFAVTGGAGSTDITGTAGNDTLVGGSGPQNIYGLAGDDSLSGGDGADRLDGGDGIDTASYASSAAAVIVDLQSGTGSGGDAEGDTLVTVENLTGSDFADQLSGNAGDNVLLGGAGNDTLIGRAGADTLDGGTGADRLEGGDGNDLYFVDNVADTLIEFDNLGLGGIDSVRSTVSLVLAANVENLTLLGSANIDATGNGKANYLIGNSGANVLDGGAGNDTMEGGLGDDTYYTNTASDIVIEAANAGTDTVLSTATRTLDANVENLTLQGTLAINGTGNAANNVLTGNEAINILTALDGDDTLLGGGGNDTLRGGAGADTLDGQAGADRMEGGDGNDLYLADDAGDTVVEFSNAGLGGIDTVRSSVSMILSANVENLTLLGTAALNGTGTGSANLLIGNDGNNILDGLAGNDTIQGGIGNDRLTGGTGTDSLDGGIGQDVAVFAGDMATYTITTANGSISIRDNDAVADGNDGTDTLIGIETAEFKGGATINLLAPIVLDLDGDGIELVNLAQSSASFDFLGNGVGTHTGWIGSGDALLAIDRDGNGTISDASELSYTSDLAGALSDLAGLAAFDSNSDGALTASDDSFGSFLVWADANGDGKADAGEVMGLAAAGIVRINLAGTATHQDWSAGENIVVAYGSFARSDGTVGSLADVAFQHDPVMAAPPVLPHHVFAAIEESHFTIAPMTTELVM